MGTWNTGILGNDTSKDVYERYFELYNNGMEKSEINSKINTEFKDELLDNEDRYNTLFAIAYAQWQINQLDPNVHKKVLAIINSGSDIKLWKDLGANEKQIVERQKKLDKFINIISIVKEKPKRRKKVRNPFTFENQANSICPDQRCRLEIVSTYKNSIYVHTQGMMYWNNGGGCSVFVFYKYCVSINAIWENDNKVNISYNEHIEFAQRNYSVSYCGDQIIIEYPKVDK
jgi:hypothetical protein